MTSPCSEWTGATDDDGYGRRRWRGKVRKAHRVAWEIAYGPIPEGAKVLHRCDNPPCIEPTHLFLGTQADNVADMIAKGRQGHRGRGVKTLCRRDHPLDGVRGDGSRYCLTCNRERARVLSD